jgi:hypothetical protein
VVNAPVHVSAQVLAATEQSMERPAAGEPMAVPVKLTICGEAGLVALSVTVKVAESEPLAVGVKTMLATQLAPGLRLVVQVLVGARVKKLELVPVTVSPVSEMTPVPVLVTVMDCAADGRPTLVAGNVRVEGLMVRV